ncbi:ATP synthase subunit C lysine N-methyltransferase isoform X2 [Wyeomyia smithii]|uniref:ATP synthase subunit C lysine N-methyltransferase isoform X2 n=1 Tax=Wyeomyia smithii TaxID=174621 RepID=UPI0024681B92|nr:ATP synthase subunit C lysine N-methyltransferase isoform X2 [Wyeomyia smithii]
MSTSETSTKQNVGKYVPVSQNNKSKSGKILIAVTGVGLSIICYSFVAPALRKHCLPYVPATTKQIKNVLSAISTSNSANKLLDIGSGDGRIVIAAAKTHSIEAHGVELNPWLVYYSRFSAMRTGVYANTKFFRKDLWKFDISNYNNIVIFGVEQMMQDLEQKITQEAQLNATIITCRFPFPNLVPISTIDDGIDSLWIYRKSFDYKNTNMKINPV